MKRKGMEVDFVLKFVLSAIGIAIIVYVAGMVLSRVLYDGDVVSAKQTLSSLITKSETLKDGESNTFIVRGVPGWYLVGWNLEDGKSRPQKCSLNSCICICNEPTKEACDSRNGICMAVKDREVSVGAVPFAGTKKIAIDSTELGSKSTAIYQDVQGTYSSSCIPLPKNFIEISITKSKELVKLTYSTSDKYLECSTFVQGS